MGIFEELVRQQAITVIVVTHEASIAAHADRLIRMRDGRIIEDTKKPARQLAATALRSALHHADDRGSPPQSITP